MRSNRKLVSAVMTRTVCQTDVAQTAMHTLALMKSKSVSSVIVTEHDLILGIITERDIVRALNRSGNLQGLGCVDLMQSPVITVPPQTPCLEAYHLMRGRGIRHLGVTDKAGHVLGIASESDMMRNFGTEYYMTFKDVGSVMSTEFSKLPAAATVADALAQMIDRHQSCVVVIDPEGRAAGVLTERDVVRLWNDQAHPEQLALSDAMQSPVKTVKAGDRLHEAVQAMEDAHIRRLVVVTDDGVVCGLLTHHEVAIGLEGEYVTYLREIVQLQARDLQQAAQAIDEKLLLANILRSVTGTAVLASDLEYRVSYATPSVAAVLGLRSEDIGGADIRATLKSLAWEEAGVALDLAAAAQVPRHYKVVTPRGRIDFQVSLLLDVKDQPQGYLVMAQQA